MSSQDRGKNRRPPRLGPLAASAWADAAARYWQGMRAQVQRTPGLPLPVVDLAPSGDSIHLLLPELAERAARALGFVAQLRYVACTPDGLVPPAWHAAPQLSAWLAEGRLVVIDQEGVAPWVDAGAAPANPVVVLAHGAWGSAAQRLFAIHYGRLLEATRQGAHMAAGASEEPWTPADLPDCGALVRRQMEAYRSRLNSAPITWPEGATRTMSRLVQDAPGGCLVLAMDYGFVSERQFRLCGFERFLAADNDRMPVNFQLLDAAWREHGAATWQLGLAREEAIQVAIVGGRGDAEALLADVIVPLRSGAFADAAAMVRLAATAVRQGDDLQLLALLRHSKHDPAVFSAACPELLHGRVLTKAGCDRAGWATALQCVVSNHLPMPGQPPLHGHLGLAAMQIAEWGLARQVLKTGMRVLGENAQDLLTLAHCEAATGRLSDALKLVTRALALDPADQRALAFRDGTRARMERWNDDWRRCFAHPDLPLLLQPLDTGHAEMLFHQYRDPQIAVMTGLPALSDVEAVRSWIAEQQDISGWSGYAVMHEEMGMVGYVGLHLVGNAALLCFWTGVDHQGRGWAAEAARLLCVSARARGIAWIFGEAFTDNLRSVRALQRAGFVSMSLETSADGESREFLCFELDESGRQGAIDALVSCMHAFGRDPGIRGGSASSLISEPMA